MLSGLSSPPPRGDGAAVLPPGGLKYIQPTLATYFASAWPTRCETGRTTRLLTPPPGITQAVAAPQQPTSSARTERSLLSQRERICVAIAVVGIVLVYAWSGRYWVDSVDEGYFLDLSQRVLEGAQPYKDFATYYTPGIFYLFALAFKVFGTNLLVIRYLMAAIHGAIALLMYRLTRRVAPWPIAWLPFAIVAAFDSWPIETEPHPSWPSLLMCLLTLEVLMRHHASGRLRLLALAGATAGVAYLFKQNIGAFTAIGVGGYILLRPRTPSGRLLQALQVGFAVGVAALVTVLMRELLDPLSAGALWLPLVVTLAILAWRAIRGSTEAEGSVIPEVGTAMGAFATVTLLWLVPLVIAIGPSQTPLGLFVGDVNQTAIATSFAAFTGGVRPFLLALIWLSTLVALTRRRVIAAGLLSVMVLLLPLWQGPRDLLTHDPLFIGPVTWFDDALGTLHLYLPSVGVWAGIAALLTLRARGPLPWYVLFGGLTALTMYPRADTLHAIASSPVALVAGAGALAAVWRNFERCAVWRRVVLTSVLLCVPLGAIAPQIAWRIATVVSPEDNGPRFDYAPLSVDRASVFAPRQTAEDLQGVVRFVDANTPPGEPLLVYPVAPLINFLADRPNPTRFDHYLPGTLTSSELEEAVTELRSGQPKYVVWDHLGVLLWQTDPANRPLTDYIWQCYRQVATFRFYLVLERVDGAC